MLDSANRDVDKGVWFVPWHFATGPLALMAASLPGAAYGRPMLALLPLGLSICFLLFFLFETLRHFRKPFALPQWTLFGALSAFIVAGH